MATTFITAFILGHAGVTGFLSITTGSPTSIQDSGPPANVYGFEFFKESRNPGPCAVGDGGRCGELLGPVHADIGSWLCEARLCFSWIIPC